jgi:hypothetical protein
MSPLRLSQVRRGDLPSMAIRSCVRVWFELTDDCRLYKLPRDARSSGAESRIALPRINRWWLIARGYSMLCRILAMRSSFCLKRSATLSNGCMGAPLNGNDVPGGTGGIDSGHHHFDHAGADRPKQRVS